MIVISYWSCGKRHGMLAWREPANSGRDAIGGYDPGDPGDRAETLTIVSTDGGEATMPGWPHPDQVFAAIESGELQFE